ncbi:hypothetical protein SCCGRSA3_00234 [Marine Group I thaumarchaeote SCGC RSA3]|uniref:Uncharacterized protein n=2 Tax=Marine Group I TaxID=905826 RepID=A0A081RQG7_9ARCH|nr:hypothetical protein AAA799N04_00132 [Marine Group I thaumarchaeote SCGC AAA799-N04]KFM20420.1 hypothetical protein SCCGRSA3_00234 [Marine Group I thaumarchaeote SCGC RSA3]
MLIMKKCGVFGNLKPIIIPVLTVVSFSYFMAELFGQTIPNTVWTFFKEASFVIVMAAAIIFALVWFWRAIPHKTPNNYTIISYDVFGESPIDGLRVEFKTRDVAWSFMKQYKKSYPLYHFALISDIAETEKKTIIRYL